METKMKKNSKISLWKWALGACLFFAGVQNAFALTCDGTIYIQAPKSWSMVTLEAGGMFPKLSVGASGWYEAKAASVGQGNTFRVNSAGTHYPAQWIDRNHYDIANNESTSEDAFTCDDLVDGTLYIYEDPTTPGKTVFGTNPPNAKYFFVMIPPELKDWMSAVPMISLDGGKTGKPMTAVADMCGWYSYVFFNETITDNVVLYRDDDDAREDMIGFNGTWEVNPENPQSIALASLFETGYDTLFFVPDEELKTNDDGFYYSTAEVQDIEGTCTYELAAIIYDSDASLHPAFSCYSQGGEGCQQGAQGVSAQQAQQYVNACIGVTPGIVESTLDVSNGKRKPKLSKAGQKCFINEQFFNQLFNYTQGVNEMSCFNMPFRRSEDGKWEFDSDYYTSPGLSVQGGFYPVEATDNATILLADPNQTPVAAARTKRMAEGPVFYGPALRELDPVEGIPVIDVLCNGPGWTKGHDCEGLFADGDGTTAAIVEWYNMSAPDDCVFGWSCAEKAPSGWPAFKDGTETPVSVTAQGAARRWTSKSKLDGGTAGRNQQFCFESHAKFTHKPGLRFNFRGDDDIWVFIDNKLAVDLGGTHLAAPGYVDLDKFEGVSGALQIGQEYNLDIFFCDRRTTMSNVRIKTNMYIIQSNDITWGTKKSGDVTSYSLVYTESGDGGCASALSGSSDEVKEFSGEALLTQSISYKLVNGWNANDPIVSLDGVNDSVSVAGVYLGGIDLTLLYQPKVDKNKFSPPAGKGGKFALFVTINGKTKRLAKWRTEGEMDVVYADAVAYSLDEDDNLVPVPNGTYKLQTSAMGNQYVPIYVSAVAPSATDKSKLEIYTADAVGNTYTLDYSTGVEIYELSPVGSYDPVESGTSRTIGPSGVDTVYAMVPMELLKGATDFEVWVKNRTNKRKITFYLPKITFIKAPADEGMLPDAVRGDTPYADGSYDEHWVGSYVPLHLAVLKPNTDSSYSLCTECELKVVSGPETSPKIDFAPDTISFVNGYASVSARAQKAYRFDKDVTVNNPATLVLNGLVKGSINDYIRASYSPIYFREPPVPFPVLADVFDARGATPTLEYNMPSKYFSMTQEYLDGIGDSVVVYYDRRIHKDSLPNYMCLLWDSLSAQSYLPAVVGWSNQAKDSINPILCNQVLDATSGTIKCSGEDANGYCDPYLKLSGLTLSKEVKTCGVGTVYSFAKFKDKCVTTNCNADGSVCDTVRCDTVKAGFNGEIIDRMAPVPLSAVVRTLKSGGELTEFDSLVVIVSEPLQLPKSGYGSRAVDYFLNSAIDVKPEENRYASSLGNSSVIVDATGDPVVSVTADNKGRIKYLYRRGGTSPHVGDYLRLGGNIATPIWSDTANYNRLSADSIRSVNGLANANPDEFYRWNSPTGYDETLRLPSPWIPVTGDAEIAVIENPFGYTASAYPGETEPITVHGYRTSLTKDEVFALEGYRPGHFVKADMFALINGLSDAEREALDINDVYFDFNVEYFTNLGSFVTRKREKIYCNDSLNKVHYFTAEGSTRLGKCTDAGMERNFFIGWNMLSSKSRWVGTGAYIVKLKSFVKLGFRGKEAKQERTSVFGAKRGFPKKGYELITDFGK